MRRNLMIGTVTASILGGSILGATVLTPSLTSAQTPPTPTQDAAGDHAARMTAKLSEALQPLVDNGTLTATQRDAVVQQLAANRPAGERGPGMGRHGARSGFLDTAATAIGVTTDELSTALRNGQTIAEVAKSKNVDPSKVIDAIVAAENERLSQAVADGTITQAQADEMKANAVQRATAIVNGTLPQGGPRGPMGGGPRGPMS